MMGGVSSHMADAQSFQQAWEDWGSVNPMYAILTDPIYRAGGDMETFLQTGTGTVEMALAEVARLGLCPERRTALDFGCGLGRLTWAVAQHFGDVVGLDVAESMVDQASKLHADVPNCRFETHRADDLSAFPDGSFDFVLCLFVLQHLPSTDAITTYLGEFVRVLRPGGALVVQLPSKVPAHRPPMPPWRSRAGVRVRAAKLLRRVGVTPHFLYRRMDWVPEMTMLGLPDDQTRSVLAAAGGQLVHASQPDIDRGGTESRIYYVTC
jgi:SAM-dependent methyltransferase